MSGIAATATDYGTEEAAMQAYLRDGEERGNPASGGGIPARDTPHDGGACRL